MTRYYVEHRDLDAGRHPVELPRKPAVEPGSRRQKRDLVAGCPALQMGVKSVRRRTVWVVVILVENRKVHTERGALTRKRM